MRKYQPIWDELKKNKTASIQAAVELHPRIIKAVSKEKYQDEGYKFLLAEAHKDAVINNRAKEEVLTFTLSFVISGVGL